MQLLIVVHLLVIPSIQCIVALNCDTLHTQNDYVFDYLFFSITKFELYCQRHVPKLF